MPEETKPELTITARRGEYKGYPMLVLTSGDNEKYPFQFGYNKAKRIVACIEDIKAFVRDCEAKKAAEAQAKTVAVK
jgi:hypothetical protein